MKEVLNNSRHTENRTKGNVEDYTKEKCASLQTLSVFSNMDSCTKTSLGLQDCKDLNTSYLKYSVFALLFVFALFFWDILKK